MRRRRDSGVRGVRASKEPELPRATLVAGVHRPLARHRTGCNAGGLDSSRLVDRRRHSVRIIKVAILLNRTSLRTAHAGVTSHRRRMVRAVPRRVQRPHHAFERRPKAPAASTLHTTLAKLSLHRALLRHCREVLRSDCCAVGRCRALPGAMGGRRGRDDDASEAAAEHQLMMKAFAGIALALANPSPSP